ncbi:MAG: hypothetical protein HY898_32985 [Deltaproteobacteria bacterium]|nr:hypothetical protein [Deltaproteobacteria bacterium]
MIQRALVFAAIGVALTLAATSQAEERRKPTKGPIEVKMVITVRPRAIVSIDVARVKPELASVQFQEAFASRVETAAYKEPF